MGFDIKNKHKLASDIMNYHRLKLEELEKVSWCADKIFDTDLVYYLEGNNKNHILSEEEFMKKISSSPLNKFRSAQFKKGMYAGYLETLK